MLAAAEDADLDRAARLLADGGVVALPTETVYGLAADATTPAAVGRVFAVKGRPSDHPLIVHLADAAEADRWAAQIHPRLRELAAEHWPGPLTIVVPKQLWVSAGITGGQETVALRVPDQGATRSVIQRLGELTGRAPGVVAPSANRFGAVSPTAAEHVLASLGAFLGAGDAVLDAGECPVGVESTIVAWDVGAGAPRVLRPGAVTVPDAVPSAAGRPGPSQEVPRVPGALAAHYSPRARVLLVGADGALPSLDRAGLVALAGVATPPGWLRLAAPGDAAAYARVLYAALRSADDAGRAVVVAVPPAVGPLAPAVLDRLQRAAAAAAG
ncbi:MAG: threonylcarbamoyl-AMP synthase [Actinobacteria bacterium]|nr:MAG: threonylcarbamoyl-AMP synthase [Actinomycetota bacterium]